MKNLPQNARNNRKKRYVLPLAMATALTLSPVIANAAALDVGVNTNIGSTTATKSRTTTGSTIDNDVPSRIEGGVNARADEKTAISTSPANAVQNDVRATTGNAVRGTVGDTGTRVGTSSTTRSSVDVAD